MNKVETRFKKGDKLLRVGQHYQKCEVGKIYTFDRYSDVYEDDLYLKEIPGLYSIGSFELVKENKEMFDINDLKTGMRVVHGNHPFTQYNSKYGIVITEMGKIFYEGGEDNWNRFYNTNSPTWKITEVYDVVDNLNFKEAGKLIWKYEPESPQQKRIKELELTVQDALNQIAKLKEETK